jgi:hypothetical protein
MNRRRLASLMIVTAALTGCAGVPTLTAEVSSYGDWPASRAAGSYAFERLPSQQARAAEQAQLEAAARPALEAAGFKPVAEGSEADHVVQLGARLTRFEASPWDDPLWWRGCIGIRRCGPWIGPRWAAPHWRDEPPRYEREVALLVRERASGKPLYEARASADGVSAGSPALWQALFAAALHGFPVAQGERRSVTVPLAAPAARP